MAHTILVRKVDGGWVVGREGHDFQRFASKTLAMDRARALIDRIGDAELVIEDDDREAESPAGDEARLLAESRGRAP